MFAPHLSNHDLHHRGDLMRTRTRPMRTVRQTSNAVHQIPADPSMQGRPADPNLVSDFDHAATTKNCTHSIQTLLDNRQDNQCQSRPPQVLTPREDVRTQSADHGHCRASTGGRMSRITWHSTR